MRKGLFLFVTGYTLYYITEFFWRGTRPSYAMAIVGGICMLSIYYFCYEKYKGAGFLILCAISSMLITFIEFIAGIILNLVLKLSIWDYSNFSLNLLGQITPVYSLLWFLISIPAIILCMACANSDFLNYSSYDNRLGNPNLNI